MSITPKIYYQHSETKTMKRITLYPTSCRLHEITWTEHDITETCNINVRGWIYRPLILFLHLRIKLPKFSAVLICHYSKQTVRVSPKIIITASQTLKKSHNMHTLNIHRDISSFPNNWLWTMQASIERDAADTHQTRYWERLGVEWWWSWDQYKTPNLTAKSSSDTSA